MSGGTRNSPRSAARSGARARSLPRFAAIYALLGLLLIGAAALAEDEVVTTDPPGRVARLSHFDGEVTFAPAGSDDWAEAILNRPVTSGDRLWTESGARAELQIGSAAAYLDERTGFGFVELGDEFMQISLTSGRATLRVRRLADGETIQVETPNVAVAVREPGEYTIEVDPEADDTVVKTRHGAVDVVADNERHRVVANQQVRFTGLKPLAAQAEPLAARSAFENWANERERRESESRSAEYVSRDVVGYEDLDEHGDWLHEPEYGYVWRPRYVAYDWVPYRDGRWVWVSPWGWTWVDLAPWGFAPFHYGRWAYVRQRWCWVPGPRHYRPVYAPALVGWIGAPAANVSVSFGSGIGWFPLGPREIYVPGYRYSPRYLRHINASNTIIVNHTYITNVYSAHPPRFDYRYSRNPRAITAVERNHFIGGRPVLGRVLRVEERELHNWRQAVRPPALTPDRGSILAGEVRRAPPAAHFNRDHSAPHVPVRRVGFDTERTRIEANGGRPVSRSQLYTGNPKEHAREFRPRPRTDVRGGDARRDFARGDDVMRSPRTLGNTTPPSSRQSLNAERVESMPARELRRGETPRAPQISTPALRGSGGVPQIREPRSAPSEPNRPRTYSTAPRTPQPQPRTFEAPRAPAVQQPSPPSAPRTNYRAPTQDSTPRSYTPSQRPPSATRHDGNGSHVGHRSNGPSRRER